MIYLLMILKVLVDLVNLEFLFSSEFLSTDVAREDLKVDLAIVIVKQVGSREGLKSKEILIGRNSQRHEKIQFEYQVANLAFFLRMVVVNVILVFTVVLEYFIAWLA